MKYLLQIMSVEVCLKPPEGTMERSVNERVEGYCNGWLHVTETKIPQRRKTEEKKVKCGGINGTGEEYHWTELSRQNFYRDRHVFILILFFVVLS